MLAAAGCVDFPNTFDRVDADMVRVLDFIYEPAEAAPGDTITVTAVFAGKKVEAGDLSWRLARDVVGNRGGAESARDQIDLDGSIEVRDSTFSDNTSCIRATFRLPPDLIEKSAAIPDDWSSLLPTDNDLDIPPTLGFLLDRDVLLPMIESVVDRTPHWAEAFARGDTTAVEDSLVNNDSLYAAYRAIPSGMLNFALQALTVRTRLSVSIAGAYTVLSDYSVRYNSAFARLPGSGVHANHNPRIDSVGIYRVAKENLIDFDPKKSRHSYTWYPLLRDGTPIDTTVLIDKGYSYFVAGHVDPASIDSVTTLDAARGMSTDTLEDLKSQWYFQLEAREIADLSAGRYMNIVNIGSLIEPLFPATDKRVRTATIWLQVYDNKLNVFFRPRGSTLAEATVSFAYTDAYLRSVE
jgi:hypothetical protein